MMIIKRKLFSGKRSEKDKKWDSVYGGSVGIGLGASGGYGLGKLNERLDLVGPKVTDKKLRKDAEKMSQKISKEFEKSINKVKKDPNIDPMGKELLKTSYEKAKNYKLNRLVNDPLKEKIADLEMKTKKGIVVKDSKKLVLPLTIGGAVVGSVLGSLYGRDNDLRRQRKKMEDAAGDKVASTIKNLGSGKEKKN